MRLRIAVTAVLLLATACSGGDDAGKPRPPPSLPPTTISIDYSNIRLERVPGTTTTIVELGPGKATLSGFVVAPEGAVPGAVVHAERLVGDGQASIDVVTLPDGSWSLPNVKGGRYRVRAWRTPDLALTKPEVFFLGGDEKKRIDLTLARYDGYAATASIAPNPPYVGEPANLVVRLSIQSVDPTGIVRAVPAPPTSLNLAGSGSWSVDTENPTFTDGNGDARWRVRCRASGNQPLAVVVGDFQTLSLEGLPPCGSIIAEPAPSPSTTSASTTSTTFRRTTTTRRTSTTR